MSFQVFDSNRPAELKASGWNTCVFQTFSEAAEYARKWLGNYDDPDWKWELNVPYPYGGCGDFVVIRGPEEFYLQSLQFTVGTCVVWHGTHGNLTTDLRKARIFTKDEIASLTLDHKEDRAWPKDSIDALAELLVLCEDLD